MSVPRIARIHFVYQFIILTLLIFAISYNEILPDKRFLFIALIPIFCYQLIIVFCCTELLPLPTWLSWTGDQNEIPTNQELISNNTGSQKTLLSDVSKSPNETNIISPSIPRARLSAKNTEKSDSVSSSDANTQTVRQNVSDIFKKAPIFTKASARRSESTKSYVFTHRDNRFEDSFDTKPNIRSYETRKWRSILEQKGSKSQTNLKSPDHLVKEKKEATSPDKLETLEESIESDLTDLSRSYSFPFRQRKNSRRIVLDDNLNDFNVPVMPAWNAVDYFGSESTNKRRKSISTEAIDRELKLINSHFEQNAKNDFTQSMEVASESIVGPVIAKKGLKSSASFYKWKQGIATYFSKTKKENNKADENKQNGGDNKKPFFKDLFSSKEVLYQGPEKKIVSSKRNGSSFSKADNMKKLSNRSPSYISYEADYFLD